MRSNNYGSHVLPRRRSSSLNFMISVIWCAIFTWLAGVYFFEILANHAGSDYENNANSIIGAEKGYYGGENSGFIAAILQEAHYYFWLRTINAATGDYSATLTLISCILASFFSIITGFRALKYRKSVFYLLFVVVVLFHPRFLDLVIGNIRSGLALMFCFCAFFSKSLWARSFFLFLGATFHLGVLPILLLHMAFDAIHKFLSKKPPLSTLWGCLFVVTTSLVLAASVFFPSRGIGSWEGGTLYTIALLGVAVMSIFASSSMVRCREGFVAMGLLFMVLWGVIMDYSTMRFFSFFLPAFASAVLLVDVKPHSLIALFLTFSFFTVLSHTTWVLSL